MSTHPYDMKTPCPQCPFRKGQTYLTSERAEEIANCEGMFPCHKTTVDVEDEDGSDVRTGTPDSKVCAGFMILREKINSPNQLMRVAERLRVYNWRDLIEGNPAVDEVYDSIEDMANSHDE